MCGQPFQQQPIASSGRVGSWWGKGRRKGRVRACNNLKSNLSHLRAGAVFGWGEGRGGVGYGRPTVSKVTYLIVGPGRDFGGVKGEAGLVWFPHQSVSSTNLEITGCITE